MNSDVSIQVQVLSLAIVLVLVQVLVILPSWVVANSCYGLRATFTGVSTVPGIESFVLSLDCDISRRMEVSEWLLQQTKN